jgi:hypothetical protein
MELMKKKATTRQRIAIFATAACVVAGGSAYAIAQDRDFVADICPPGSHFIVTAPDGSTLEIRRDIRDLPPGAYITAGGIRVSRDGVVKGGKVECIDP